MTRCGLAGGLAVVLLAPAANPGPLGGSSVARAAPGVAVSSVAAPPRLLAGGRARVRVTLVNRSRRRARGVTLRFSLSSNAVQSSADLRLGVRRVRGLAPRARRRVVTVLRAPAAAPSGARLRVLACVEPRSGARARCRAGRRALVVGASAIDRIEADRRSGRLDAQRALLLKLYAVHGDDRLPARYRGRGAPRDATEVVLEARMRRPALDPEVAALVDPFLVPPIYRGSFADPAHRSARRAQQQVCEPDLARWDSLATPKGLARFWWRRSAPADAARAAALARELDGPIWTVLTSLMGTDPGLDGYLPCSGTDSLLDVYLHPLDPETVGYAQAYNTCTAGPSYIVLRPDASRSLLAHEFMHVLQHRYDRRAPCADYAYLQESTATWAEDRVYPGDQEEHLLPALVLLPGHPLHADSGYSGWAFHYSVTRASGSDESVPAIWRAAAAKAPLDALDAALPGGIAETWPAFAGLAWNRSLPDALVESFFSWDRFTTRPLVEPREVRLRGFEHREPLPVELRGLGKQYHHLRFTDRRAREVVLHDVSPVAEDPRLRTRAFVKVAGRPWRSEDWTGGGVRRFCRDRPDEDLREIVLVHTTTTRPHGDRWDLVLESIRPQLGLRRFCERPSPYLKATALSVTVQATGSYVTKGEGGKRLCDTQYTTHTTHDFVATPGETYDGELVLEEMTTGGVSAGFGIEPWFSSRSSGRGTQTCVTEEGQTLVEQCSFDRESPASHPGSIRFHGEGRAEDLDSLSVAIRLHWPIAGAVRPEWDWERGRCSGPGSPARLPSTEVVRSHPARAMRSGSTISWDWSGGGRIDDWAEHDVDVSYRASFGFRPLDCRRDCEPTEPPGATASRSTAPASAATAYRWQVVPRRRLGIVKLGMSRAQVERRLGEPEDCGGGLCFYEYPGSEVRAGDFWVFYRRGRIRSLSTSIRRFGYRGVHLGMSTDEVHRTLRRSGFVRCRGGLAREVKYWRKGIEYTADLGTLIQLGLGPAHSKRPNGVYWRCGV